MIPMIFNSETEARGFLIYQIWIVTGFLSQLLISDEEDDGANKALLISILYMALGPLNIIRIMIKRAIRMRVTSKKKKCTYTKWHIYYKKEDETTSVVYKTRYKRPNWWPKNISSPGYNETIKLATVYASLQHRYIIGHHLTGYYIDHIEWNKEANIGFIERLRVKKKIWYIDRHELYLTDWT